jgi:hypothetical protein
MTVRLGRSMAVETEWPDSGGAPDMVSWGQPKASDVPCML